MTRAERPLGAAAGQARILIEIGPGELADRLSILELKVARAPHEAGLLAARDALASKRARMPLPRLAEETALAQVNAELWATEDRIRRAEACGDFGSGFVALARRIIALNGRRSDLKAAIDRRGGVTQQTEVKIYDL